MPAANMGTVPGFDLLQIDRLLTTTRAVRKRLDLERPVEPQVIQECIWIATQAPTGGGYGQQWRWLIVTDPQKRARLAELYRDTAWAQRVPDDPRDIERLIRLTATDIAFTAGAGQEVQGTAEALLMAITGRRAALSELSGPGRAKLARVSVDDQDSGIVRADVTACRRTRPGLE